MTHFQTLSKLFLAVYGREFGLEIMKFITHTNRSEIINGCTCHTWNNFIIVQTYWNLRKSGMSDIHTICEQLMEQVQTHCVDVDSKKIVDDFKNSMIKIYIDNMFIMIGDNKLALIFLHKLALLDFLYHLTDYDTTCDDNDKDLLALTKAKYFELMLAKTPIVNQQLICYTNIIEIISNVNHLRRELHLIDEIAKSLSIQMSLLSRPF
jgi:hypothetical protein